MTLPTPDAQSPKSLSPYSRQAFANHSIPPDLSLSSPGSLSSPAPLRSETDSLYPVSHARVSVSADFSHSWDLATGGLKTLTAKRELPPRQMRAQVTPPVPSAASRSYMFLLVILACIVVMLISGGVVLFMMLQP